MKFPYILSIILLATIAISSCSIVNAFGSQVHMAALPTATCSNAQLASSCGGTNSECHALVNALQNSIGNPLAFIFLLALAVVVFFIPQLRPRIQRFSYRLVEINISPPKMLLADGLPALRI